MSDKPSVDERIAALEKMVSTNSSVGARLLWLFGVSSLLALLTGNLWLLNRAQMARVQSATEHDFWVVSHAYPERERTEAFLHLITAGNKEWRSARLSGLNLAGLSLPNANLEHADFSGANLHQGSFVGARFTDSKLVNADLTKADLSEADLAGADMFKTLIRGAQLRRANLRGAVLQQVEAQGAVLIAANLADGYLLMANLTGAKLEAADLSGANLEAAILKEANLSLARLNGAKLKDADLTNCNWWRARGIASDQLALLIKNFPPTAKADVALRQDYQDWLKKLEPSP